MKRFILLCAVVVLSLSSSLRADSVDDVLALARKTLAFVEKSAKRPKLAARLVAIEKRLASAPDGGGEVLSDLKALRRRIILSHPLLDFEKLLINKRPPPFSLYSHMCDQYYGRHSKSGPGLTVLSAWKTVPKPTVLLAGKLPIGSVLHPDLSFDAKKVIFAFCDHTEAKPAGVKIPTHPTVVRGGFVYKDIGQRRFFIYEATLDGKTVRQLTGGPGDPMTRAGGRQTVMIEDFDPCYLPDGGFAFVSTRCQSFGRCHWGRYTPAYLLYRGEGDGSGIRQISFGEANEWDPSVLPDGRLVYARWDYINRHNTWFQSLWVTRPDGSATEHYYGNYSVNPCMNSEALAVPGSHKVVSTATAHHFISAGSVMLIDPRKGRDGMEPVERITPEVKFPETEGWGLKGCYTTPYPLSEDLYLVSYSPEIVNWDRRKGRYGGTWPSASAFGIYLIDTLGGRELIYRDPKVSCYAPIPIRPRRKPPALPPVSQPGSGLKTGVFMIQDVHRSTEKIPAGTIKAVRVNRIHSQPAADKSLLTYASSQEILKSVVGTVPVSSGGTVAFQAPACETLQLQVLDADGLAVMTMRSSVYLQPGEVSACVGCHESRKDTPVLQAIPGGLKIQSLTPPDGPKYPGGLSFARTVQPVLDRHCISCHGLKAKPDGKLSLIGRRTRFNAAYDALIKTKGLVKMAMGNGETHASKPKDYFAHAGKLAGILRVGKHTRHIKLDQASFQRIVDWMDLNVQYFGDYSYNRPEQRSFDFEGVKALKAYVAELFGEKLSAQPIEALVNVALPTSSRILKAPLALSAGGWGQIEKGAWKSTDAPGYRKMLKLVEGAIAPLAHKDIDGTCGREKCACRSCWVRKLRTARIAQGGK